jgi:phosphohistidine phosphatase
MRLILLRHGPAGRRDAERWPDDGLRPLTSRGIKRSRDAARGLARVEPGIGLIVSSPLARALQTARVFARALDVTVVEELDALRPGGSREAILEFLAAHTGDRSVMLVGHEPDLGELAGALLFGPPSPLAMKKAGACAIAFEAEPRIGAGSLHWFLPAKMLARLAAKTVRV